MVATTIAKQNCGGGVSGGVNKTKADSTSNCTKIENSTMCEAEEFCEVVLKDECHDPDGVENFTTPSTTPTMTQTSTPVTTPTTTPTTSTTTTTTTETTITTTTTTTATTTTTITTSSTSTSSSSSVTSITTSSTSEFVASTTTPTSTPAQFADAVTLARRNVTTTKAASLKVQECVFQFPAGQLDTLLAGAGEKLTSLFKEELALAIAATNPSLSSRNFLTQNILLDANEVVVDTTKAKCKKVRAHFDAGKGIQFYFNPPNEAATLLTPTLKAKAGGAGAPGAGAGSAGAGNSAPTLAPMNLAVNNEGAATTPVPADDSGGELAVVIALVLVVVLFFAALAYAFRKKQAQSDITARALTLYETDENNKQTANPMYMPGNARGAGTPASKSPEKAAAVGLSAATGLGNGDDSTGFGFGASGAELLAGYLETLDTTKKHELGMDADAAGQDGYDSDPEGFGFNADSAAAN